MTVDAHVELAPRTEGTSRRAAWLALILFVLTLALYGRSVAFDFLNYDDDVYVTRNPAVRLGLAPETVRWAFTTDHAANWHPLTWLSHMLDVELFGLEPGAHHLTSAILHALNAALLLLVLSSATKELWPSAFCAAFFALHPLRVESVAWVAERKDVLAGVFWMSTLLAWVRYARRGGWARYAIALGCFVLGLLAKPMLVTLPFVLLLLDVWPLERWRSRRAPVPSPAPTHPGGQTDGAARGFVLIGEKIPFFLLAAASCVVTAIVQRAGGAIGPLGAIGLTARIANAIESYAIYVLKTLWPTQLSAFRPHPALSSDFHVWHPTLFAAAALLLGACVLAWALRRRAPGVLVGWLWFLGTLVPVIGLVQVGLQAWADRYSYLPSVGLGIALAWGALASLRSARLQRLVLAPASIAIVAACALLTWRQLGVWKDSSTLFAHALAIDPRNFLAHTNLGQALEAQGKLDEAAEHYVEALRLRGHLAPVRASLGKLRLAQGRFDEAAAELERALLYDPELVDAHASLGWTRFRQARDQEAIEHMRRAVELSPRDHFLANNLAWMLATSPTAGRPEEALALAQRLCRLTGKKQPGFLETLAAALARLQRYDEAEEWQRRALESVPEEARPELEARLELYRSGKPFFAH